MEGHQSLKLGRRKFLGLGSAALVGLSLKSERKTEGGFVNDSFQMGHLLRDRAGFPARSALKNSPSSLSEAESPASALPGAFASAASPISSFSK